MMMTCIQTYKEACGCWELYFKLSLKCSLFTCLSLLSILTSFFVFFHCIVVFCLLLYLCTFLVGSLDKCIMNILVSSLKAFQRCPCPNPKNLVKGIQVAGEIKNASRLASNRHEHPDLASWTQCIHKCG